MATSVYLITLLLVQQLTTALCFLSAIAQLLGLAVALRNT